MGNRYYITGVQIGILMSEVDNKIKMDILERIAENQFLGNVDEKNEINIGDLK